MQVGRHFSPADVGVSGWGLRVVPQTQRRLRHPVVGELTLSFEAMELHGDCDQTLAIYHAEPRSASRKALWLLTDLAASRTEPTSCQDI